MPYPTDMVGLLRLVHAGWYRATAPVYQLGWVNHDVWVVMVISNHDVVI